MIQTSFFKEEEEIFIDPNGLSPVKMENLIKNNKDFVKGFKLLFSL